MVEMTELARFRERGLTEAELLILLKAEREMALGSAQRPPEPAPRNIVPWIVGGVLFGLAMMFSFAWQGLNLFLGHMREQAILSHEEKMAAMSAAAVRVQPAAEGGDDFVVGAMVALAAICIIIGIIRR